MIRWISSSRYLDVQHCCNVSRSEGGAEGTESSVLQGDSGAAKKKIGATTHDGALSVGFLVGVEYSNRTTAENVTNDTTTSARDDSAEQGKEDTHLLPHSEESADNAEGRNAKCV